MKHFIILLIVLCLAAAGFSQQADSTQPSIQTDYLKKSKKQKTGGAILLTGGILLMGTGLIISTGDDASFDDAASGGALILTGTLAALGSIPLFILSGKNKKRAMAVSSSFEMRTRPALAGPAIAIRSYPSLSLKITF